MWNSTFEMGRRINTFIVASILILFIAFLGGCMSNAVNHWFSVRWLQYLVKRNVNPDELQRWATNLLAEHDHHYEDFYGTNVPSGVSKVQSYPAVRIDAWDEGNFVLVFADRKGAPFLVVGPPTSATPTNSRIVPWRPGMYFVR